MHVVEQPLDDRGWRRGRLEDGEVTRFEVELAQTVAIGVDDGPEDLQQLLRQLIEFGDGGERVGAFQDAQEIGGRERSIEGSGLGELKK